MAFNEQPLLTSAGRISRKQMEQIARERYDSFNQQRANQEARDEDARELQELEKLQERLQTHKKGQP